MIRFKYLFKLSLIMVLCISLFTHGVSANLAEMNDEVQTELQEYETVNLPHISVTDSVYKNLDVPTLLADDELVVYPGQSFEIYNITSSSLTQYNNASLSAERYFDYVSYREDGTIYNLGWDTAVNHAVPRGGVFVITVTSPNPVTFKTREGLIPSRTERPALKKETLYRGQNISVVNNTAGSSSILANTNRSESKWLDYSLYDVDGNYRSFAFQTTSLPSIPSGGEMILSSSGVSPVTIAVPYIGFDIRSSMEPALHNITLNQGQSYELNNIGNRAIRMESDATSSNGLRFDYAVYLPDGTSDSRGVNTYTTPSISAGNKVVVTTVSHGAVNFGVPYRLFSGRYVSGPAIKRITLNEGQSYVFRNHGSKSNPIYIDTSITDGSYDYSIYKSDGNMASSTNWGMDSKGSKSISAGGYAIITVSSSTPVTFEYTDDFSVEVYNTSALLRVTIPKDQSYEFENIGNLVIIPKSNAAVSNGLRFDYAVYLPDGTSTRRSVDTYSPPYTTAGDRAVVTTVSEEAVTFAVPYDLFEGRNVPGPAIKRFRVHEGQSYIFRNHGSQSNSIDIDTPEGSFDYVLYNSNGTNPSSFWNMDYKKDLTIPAGGYAIVTVNSSTPVTFRYTDDFSVEVSTSPALLRVTIPKGQSYEFININSKTNIGTTPKSNATLSNGLRFDYVVYLPDGSVYSNNSNTYTIPSISSGKRVVITTVSEEAVTVAAPYELFDGQFISDDAISRIMVSDGESYLFRNYGSQDSSIRNDASKVGGFFDYVVYRSDGTVAFSSFNSQSRPQIPAGGYGIITVHSPEPITFEYTSDFTVEQSAIPAMIRATLGKGESYEFTNIGNVSRKIMSTSSNSSSEPRKFNYVIYTPDGVEYSHGIDTNYEPLIKPGHKVIFTTVTVQPITFAAIYSEFEGRRIFGEPIGEDAFYDIIKEVGETGYYRIIPEQTGPYRIITKSSIDSEQQISLELYDNDQLINPLTQSTDFPSPFGEEYTYIEYNFVAGQTYYLKLSETDGEAIDVTLVASAQPWQSASEYQYDSSGKLIRIVLFSGDQILYEYDDNGNLIRKSKRVFPFINE